MPVIRKISRQIKVPMLEPWTDKSIKELFNDDKEKEEEIKDFYEDIKPISNDNQESTTQVP